MPATPPIGADPLDGLRRDPGHAVVLTDFDGTLSPLVDDPAAAVPAPGAVDALVSLAGRYALVGVVSGRPLSFLRSRLDVDQDLRGRPPGPGLWLSGLYGLETFEDGEATEAEAARPWRSVVESVTDRAAERFGAAVEGKGLSLTLHFRTEPDLEPMLRSWAEQAAEETGLILRPAKASFELHPPVEADKGSVVEAAAGRAEQRHRPLRALCFLGDDRGDLPAFDALDRLAGRGLATVRVAVATTGTPDDLLDRADLVVDGPAGAVDLLRSL